MDISASREGGAARLLPVVVVAAAGLAPTATATAGCGPTDERCERASSLYHPPRPSRGSRAAGCSRTLPAIERLYAVVQQQSRHISLGPSFSLTPRINSDSCQTRQARQRREPRLAGGARRGACRPPRNE
ncbi:hypothetical protein EVAR_82954_1 [Eumeta japonica]|uniref:Uncharacterized protein n=1 Tax=Eumeta variegata TaxID=151549 RepID=A0A4C1VT51_EUMVA|nr:hypothetical protein EVAR_82954_1 [Eumeta japonica]